MSLSYRDLSLLSIFLLSLAFIAVQSNLFDFKQSGTGEKRLIEKNNFDSPRICQEMMINGHPSNKADILLVGRNYRADSVMMEDFRYYMDFNQTHRGLFDVYPMNVSMEKFNVWVLDAGENGIAYYGDKKDGRGLIKDARDWFAKCPFADYPVVMSEDGFGRSAFSVDNEMYIPNVSQKVRDDNGAVALIHEWGHGFGDLKDEYSRENGRNASGKPNCAPSREAADEWWGEMARKNPNVGFERGCAYTEDNWEPHPGGTIMGDGGLWHYGPVNDRALLEKLEEYK